MGDKDDQTETDGTEPIRDEHRDVRLRLLKCWNERASGDSGEPSLAAAWQPLAILLENHEASEERDDENP